MAVWAEIDLQPIPVDELTDENSSQTFLSCFIHDSKNMPATLDAFSDKTYCRTSPVEVSMNSWGI